MQKYLFYLSLVSILFLPTSCKNYIGNPHKIEQAPRLAQVAPNDLSVEPSNWWIGMQYDTIEIVLHGSGLAGFACRMQAYEGVKLLHLDSVENTNYRFATITIAPNARPGKLGFYFSKNDKIKTVEFPIYRRDARPKGQGLSAKDAVYLIFPDRFANGDPKNDSLAYLFEAKNRSDADGRQGGDLKGILDHLAYVKELGCTAIWLNPELENNQTATSYHGYAVTDLYKIDPRLGSNSDYRHLVDSAHVLGLKIIRDIVPNHVGDQHPWLQDLPEKDWFHVWDTYQQTSFRSTPLLDPYASEADYKRFNAGWFDRRMPDLNQSNPHVANYLKQQAIWWVEYAGLDAFRMDTYAYSDPDFMASLCSVLHRDYPSIYLVGEIWENSVLSQAVFAKNNVHNNLPALGQLDGVLDLRMCLAMHEALLQEPSWDGGLAKLYETLAQDFVYNQPYNNLIFLDNHDMTRFFSLVKNDMQLWKAGMAVLTTLRGIPQIYYGSELLFEGQKNEGDGALRKDFPGGWAEDSKTKFDSTGRTINEQQAFDFLQKLLQFRQQTPALQTGQLTQFIPENGLYVYFRFDEKNTIMVVLNPSNREKTLDLERFKEKIAGFKTAKNILTEEIIPLTDSISILPKTTLILDLK